MVLAFYKLLQAYKLFQVPKTDILSDYCCFFTMNILNKVLKQHF